MENEQKYYDLIINCEVMDIDFEDEVRYPNMDTLIPQNQQLLTLYVLVKGIKIPTSVVDFYVHVKENRDGSYTYHPNIEVAKPIRRHGVMFKVYQAFIRIFGHATSYHAHRHENACNDLSGKRSTKPVDGCWQKLSLTPDIHVNDIYDENGKVIGQQAYSTDYLMNMDKN